MCHCVHAAGLNTPHSETHALHECMDSCLVACLMLPHAAPVVAIAVAPY